MDIPKIKETSILIDKSIYSHFVKPENFSNDLTITPQKTYNKEILTASGSTSSSEKFNSACDTKTVFSTRWIMNKDVEFTIEGVKTKQDYGAFTQTHGLLHDATATGHVEAVPAGNGSPAVAAKFTSVYIDTPKMIYLKNNRAATIEADIISKIYPNPSYSSETDAGNSNPYQAPFMGFKTDIINQCQQVALSLSGASLITTATFEDTKQMNEERYKLDKEQALLYDGLRYPNHKLTRYAYAIPYTNISTYNVSTKIADNSIDEANTGFSKDKYSHRNVTLSYNVPTIHDLNNDPEYSLAHSKRGAVWRNKKVTYTFTKSLPSRNYYYEVTDANTGGRFKLHRENNADETTRLYTMFDPDLNCWFPTNVSNWQEAVKYVGYNRLQYFTNGLAHDQIDEYGEKMAFYFNEPADQSVNITCNIKKLESPLFFRGLLTDQDTFCMSNIKSYTYEVTHFPKTYELLECCYTGNTQVLAYNTSNVKDAYDRTTVSCRVTFSNQILYLKHYDLGATLTKYAAGQTLLPFTRTEVRSVDSPRDLTIGINQDSVTASVGIAQAIEVTSIGQGIPTYLYVRTTRENTYISDLSITTNDGGNNLINSITFHDLQMKTRNNGYIGYTIKDATGNYLSTHKKTPVSLQYHSSGTIYCIKFGTDINLPDLHFPGLLTSGIWLQYSCNVTMKRILTQDLTKPESAFCTVHFLHDFDSYILLDDNTAGSVTNVVYNPGTLTSVIQSYMSSLNNAVLSVPKMVGGSLYSRIKNVLPRYKQDLKDIHKIGTDLYKVGTDNEDAIKRLISKH